MLKGKKSYIFEIPAVLWVFIVTVKGTVFIGLCAVQLKIKFTQRFSCLKNRFYQQ